MDNIYRRIREKYGLSKSAMGTLLGMGINQWRLYETGAIEPKRSHKMLIGIVQDPRSFKRFLVLIKNSVVWEIGEKRYRKLIDRLDGILMDYDNLDAERYKKWVEELWR